MKTCVLALLAALASPCLAQTPTANPVPDAAANSPPPPPALPKPSMEPQVYPTADGKLEWRRPAEVKYVMLSGCGAGTAGGMHKTSKDAIAAVSHAGRSAAVTTVLIGPLSADVYTATAAAPGGTEAAASTFVGSDVSISLPGASGADVLTYKQVPGFLPANNGAASAFGPGGISGKQQQNGADATSACAGGGAPGRLAEGGGKGGPGRLVVYPLPDLQRLLDVLAKLQPETPTPASTAQSGAP